MNEITGTHTIDVGEDAVIRVTLNGILTAGQAREMMNEFGQIVPKLKNQCLPRLMLLDLSCLKEYDDQVIESVFELLDDDFQLNRIAVVGIDLLEKIVLAIADKFVEVDVKLFESLEMATIWLKE